jgi:nucleoside-diphosphate-sugar epimerase
MNPIFTDWQKTEKIFILGATGFIGAAVVKRLLSLGFTNLHCLYRSEVKRELIFSGTDTSSVTFLKGDVSSIDVIEEGISGAAVVFNASGMAADWGVRAEFYEVNVRIPQAVVGIMESAKTPAQFIHITTAAVYGFSKEEKTEASPVVKSDRFYTGSKSEIHAWMRERMKTNLPAPAITIIAPSIVWGPGDQIYIPSIRDRLKTGQMFYIGKEQGMDFVFIDDLVAGILLCFFNRKAFNQEYILSGPEPFTFTEYIDTIAEFAGTARPKIRIPYPAAYLFALIMEGLARLVNVVQPRFRPLLDRFQVYIFARPFHLKIVKAGSELGYQPRTTFAKGRAVTGQYISCCPFRGLDVR